MLVDLHHAYFQMIRAQRQAFCLVLLVSVMSILMVGAMSHVYYANVLNSLISQKQQPPTPKLTSSKPKALVLFLKIIHALIKSLPKGICLTAIKQAKHHIIIRGYASSVNDILTFKKNIEHALSINPASTIYANSFIFTFDCRQAFIPKAF